MKLNFYVDGFNLYNRRLKGGPYRWLDLATLFGLIFPNDQVHRIRYFSAKLGRDEYDPTLHVRQMVYWRALRTIPNLTIHEGKFLRTTPEMKVADRTGGLPAKVRVERSQEKRTDVNLATYLLLDAFDDDFEMAVVVSNDSDLVLPIQVIPRRFKKKVGVLFPMDEAETPSYDLQRHASFTKHIPLQALINAQFPPILKDETGVFHKPTGW